MTIELYNNSSPMNKVQKELTSIGTLTGTMRGGVDVLNPTILVNSTSDFTASEFASANYMRISDFNRYYYITGVAVPYTGLYTISGHVDVLQTYWDSISQCDCIIGRNEFKRTKDLIDTELWITADSLYGFKNFPNAPFREPVGQNYVIILQGAG